MSPAAGHRALVIRALEQLRGDDLYRARTAFRGMGAQEMAQQYGQSGRTRQQILDGYEEHNARIDAAIAWVKGQGS